MKMKRIGIAILAVVVALSVILTGCGLKGNDNANADTSGQSGNKPKDTVKLTVWSGYPELDSWFNKMAAEYSAANSNVTIEVASFPLRDFEQKVAASLPSKSCADIIGLTPNLAIRYIKENMLIKAPDDLSKFVTGGAYAPAIVDTVQHEGIIYGVPFMYGTSSLYINKKILAEAGLTEPPKTMNELLEYAKKLAKYDESGKLVRSGLSLRLTGGGSGLAEKFWIMMMQNGGSIVEEVSPAKYRAGYDNEAGLKTLQMYIDMVHKYKTDNFDILHDAEAFEAEKTAMFARETWVIGDIKSKAPGLDYITAPMPNANIANAEDLFITNSGDENRIQAAWDFVRFLMKNENHKQMTVMSGWQQGRLDLDMEDFFAENPQYRAFFAEYDKLYTVPMLDEFDEIETRFADRLTNKGFTDPSFVDNPEKMKAFLSECAAETNSILKENGHLAQ